MLVEAWVVREAVEETGPRRDGAGVGRGVQRGEFRCGGGPGCGRVEERGVQRDARRHGGTWAMSCTNADDDEGTDPIFITWGIAESSWCEQ